MELKAARLKYYYQKKNAQRRGIGWELTFQQWLDWWGPDLDRRGRSPESLQMQRVADTGPYALGNIRKATPRVNMQTMGKMRRKRAAERALASLESARNADLGRDDRESEEDVDEMYCPHHRYRSDMWEPKY